MPARMLRRKSADESKQRQGQPRRLSWAAIFGFRRGSSTNRDTPDPAQATAVSHRSRLGGAAGGVVQGRAVGPWRARAEEHARFQASQLPPPAPVPDTETAGRSYDSVAFSAGSEGQAGHRRNYSCGPLESFSSLGSGFSWASTSMSLGSPKKVEEEQPFTDNWERPFDFCPVDHEMEVVLEGVSRLLQSMMVTEISLTERRVMNAFETDGGTRLEALLLEFSESAHHRFQSHRPAHHSIRNFVQAVHDSGGFPPAVPICAIDLLHRVVSDSSNRLRLLPSNWKAMFLTAVLVAQKSLDDVCMDVPEFNHMCPFFDIARLQRMEFIFLGAINFDIETDREAYSYWYHLFYRDAERRRVPVVSPDPSPRPSPTAREASRGRPTSRRPSVSASASTSAPNRRQNSRSRSRSRKGSRS